MKKLLTTTALVFTLALSGAAMADSPSVTESYMDKAISRLPQDKADAFRDTLSDAHEQNRDMYEQIHQLHQELHDILTADTFDANAFVAKSAELRALHDKMGSNIDQAFANAASQLSPKEREHLANAMERSEVASHAAAKQAATKQQ